MRNWLWLMAGLLTPCFGSTLKGVVTNSDSLGMYKAKVFVFHDLATILAQRKSTDFNGNYQINLDPGPYRILILKKGFVPLMERVLIVSEQEDVVLKHVLETQEESLSRKEENPTNRIKEALRGSNLNLRAESAPAWIGGLDPDEAEGMVGTVRSGARRAFSGETEHIQELELSTQVRGISLKSRVMAGEDGAGNGAMRLNAEMGMDSQRLKWGLEAESIRDQAFEDGYSHMASLFSSYGDTITFDTKMQMVATSLDRGPQQQLMVDQGMRYQLGRHTVSHGAALTDWRGEERSFARRTLLNTGWQHEQAKWLQLSAELDELNLEQMQEAQMRFWAKGQQRLNHLEVEANLGYHTDKHDADLVQKHRITGRIGAFEVQVAYADERAYHALVGEDVFGQFKPMASRVHESFIASRNRSFNLGVSLAMSSQWFSELKWTSQRDQGRLLYAQQEDLFLNQAVREGERFDYALHANRYNATLSLTYKEEEGLRNSFDQRSIAYRQSFSPWRDKDLALLFELRLQDQPDLPAWWLLSRLPWEADENWYEGHVALQF